jgi:hypothetical protein
LDEEAATAIEDPSDNPATAHQFFHFADVNNSGRQKDESNSIAPKVVRAPPRSA